MGLCESGRLTRQTDVQVDALCDKAEGLERHCERQAQVYQVFKYPGPGSTGMRTDVIYDHRRVVEVDHGTGKRVVGTGGREVGLR